MTGPERPDRYVTFDDLQKIIGELRQNGFLQSNDGFGIHAELSAEIDRQRAVRWLCTCCGRVWPDRVPHRDVMVGEPCPVEDMELL